MTTILQIIAKPGLVPWARNIALKSIRETLENTRIPYTDPALHAQWINAVIEEARAAPDRTSNEAATFGKTVHDCFHHWLTGRRRPGWEKAFLSVCDVEEDVADAAIRFATWLDSAGLTVHESEKLLYCLPCGYAGTVDVIAKNGDGGLVIIDLKTGNRLYPEMALQVAAYAHAYETMLHGATITHQASVATGTIHSICLFRVSIDAEVNIEQWQDRHWQGFYNDFMAAKQLWDRFHDVKQWWHLQYGTVAPSWTHDVP